MDLRSTMRRAATIPQPVTMAPGLVWAVLACELAAATLLAASDKLPGILLRSLQVFLRF
jgi:hypothetical protein